MILCLYSVDISYSPRIYCLNLDLFLPFLKPSKRYTLDTLFDCLVFSERSALLVGYYWGEWALGEF